MLVASDFPAERVARTIASVVGALALLILIGGWVLGIDILRTILPQWSPMAPLTALLFVLLSCSILWFERRHTLANVLLLIGFLAGAAVLAEYLLDVRLGFEALSAILDTRPRVIPESPAPDTAAAIMMLALALGCYRTTRGRIHDFADVTVIVIVIICIEVLVGYTYSVGQRLTFSGYRHIAPATTISMALLAMGALAYRPTPGISAALTGPEQSARLLRILIPVTLVLCIIVGWLHLIALQYRVGGTVPEIVAWTVTGAVVVLSLALFVTSAEMRKVEATVRRRQEDLTAAMHAAEAASDAKSRFMGVMSHELRTPLTAMIGYADLLDAGVAGELSKDAKDYTNRIRASGWHLVGLIDGVLFYAGDRMPAEHAVTSRVDVRSLLLEMERTFTPLAADKGLALMLDAHENPTYVDVDERKLRQILINLVSNAVKFTEQGAITMSLRSNVDTVRIEVRDTGVGIDAENLRRIWEPFQLIDGSHTRTQGGIGLGLALTRRLTEQLGARINAVSTVGKGATFTVELPKAAPQDREQTRLAGMRILVVDDESTVRKIMVRTLSQHGAQVTEAESAMEALKVIGVQNVDVLVTDISMPGMTGIQLAERIQAQKPGIPTLFVTGAELDLRDQASIAALDARLLIKPFDMLELARTVRSLIERRP